jgi:hypothetical protein
MADSGGEAIGFGTGSGGRHAAAAVLTVPIAPARRV